MSESDTVLKKRVEVSTPLISNQNFIKKRMLEKSTFKLFNTQSLLLIIKSDILKLKKKIYNEIFSFACEMSIALFINNVISTIDFCSFLSV